MGDRFDRSAVRKGHKRSLIALLAAMVAIVGVVLPASADAAAPAAPDGVWADGDGLVHWTPPSAEDAAIVTGYHLTADDGTDPVLTADVAPDATEYQFVVQPEKLYLVSVVVESDAGNSAPARNYLCLCTAPAPLTDIQVGTLPNGHYGVSWQPPVDWGGPQHGYSVSLDGLQWGGVSLGTGTRDFVDLSDGHAGAHKLTVIARSWAGSTSPVVIDTDIPLPPRVPGPLVSLRVTDTVDGWTFSWDPSDDGGGHQWFVFSVDGTEVPVELSPDGARLKWSATWLSYDQVPQRMNAVHVITIQHGNRRGDGPTATLTVLHGGGPEPFQHVSITPAALLSWSQPAQAPGAAAVMTSQSIYIDGQLVEQGLDPSLRIFQLGPEDFGPILDNRTHTIEVSAVAADGEAYSPQVLFQAPPIAPESVVVSHPLADHAVVVRWHEANPKAVVSYQVKAIVYDVAGWHVAKTVTLPGTATAVTMQGLPADLGLELQVGAIGATGPWIAGGLGEAWAAVPTSMRLYQTHIVGSRGTKQHATIWLRRGDETIADWLPRARVSLYTRVGAQWRFVAHAMTDSHGKAVVDLPNQRSAHYRIAFPAQRVAGVRYAGSSGTLSMTLR